MSENAKPKVNKGKKVINIVINVLLVLVFVFGIICSYTAYVSKSGNGVPDILGIRFFSIQTDSMEGTIDPGSLVISTKVKDPSTLKEKDIITFWFYKDGGLELNTHRIVEIADKGTYLSFTTKGDNLKTNDKNPVHQNDIEGKYLFHIPGLGSLIDFLQSSIGFLIVIVLPVFLFFVYNLVRFFRVFFDYRMQKMRLQLQQEMAAQQAAAEPIATAEPEPESDPDPQPEPEADTEASNDTQNLE